MLVHFVVVFVMGTVTGFWVLALGLAVGGLCTAVFAAMQATLIYMAAPEGMRGRVLGLMPHPDRAYLPFHAPDWRRTGLAERPDGMVIFDAMVRVARAER